MRASHTSDASNTHGPHAKEAASAGGRPSCWVTDAQGERQVTCTPSPPIITLLTDFGTQDAYVGALKGALLTHCPHALLVDLSHDIPPQDVAAAAFVLWSGSRWFPPGTFHLPVVDPGVGTARRILVATLDGHHFIAPDNGLLTWVLRGAHDRSTYALRCTPNQLAASSDTFQARDLMAAALARWARGIPPPTAPLSEPPVELQLAQAERCGEVLAGTVIHLDRFGNCITNITRAACERLAAGGPLKVIIGSKEIRGLRRAYGEAAPGELLALINSVDLLEIAVAEDSAAIKLGLTPGTPVQVRSLK